jgi:hypothetical protein
MHRPRAPVTRKLKLQKTVKHVPYVVGMNKAIGDKAAIKFATLNPCAVIAMFSIATLPRVKIVVFYT